MFILTPVSASRAAETSLDLASGLLSRNDFSMKAAASGVSLVGFFGQCRSGVGLIAANGIGKL